MAKKEQKVETISLAKEIKKIKSKLNENVDINYSIKDLSMSDIIPQMVDGNLIYVQNGYHTQYLPEGMIGEKYKMFKRGKGGVFCRDTMNFSKGKRTGRYVLIEGNDERFIARLIEDDELLMFQTLKLIDGLVKDKPYMTLRVLEHDEKLTSYNRYIKERNIDYENMEEPANPAEQEFDENFPPLLSNVPLFDE